MKKKSELITPPMRECAASDCPNRFSATRSDRIYCSNRCRARVQRRERYVPTGKPVGRPKKVAEVKR